MNESKRKFADQRVTPYLYELTAYNHFYFNLFVAAVVLMADVARRPFISQFDLFEMFVFVILAYIN